MPKNVQIRNVDDATYEVLRARAAASDLSLTQYLRRELETLARVATMTEWLARTDRWRERHGGIDRDDMAAVLDEARAERDARE